MPDDVFVAVVFVKELSATRVEASVESALDCGAAVEAPPESLNDEAPVRVVAIIVVMAEAASVVRTESHGEFALDRRCWLYS